VSERLDVVVIGGGPAGTAVAIELARSGRSVALFEQSHYDQLRIGETLPPLARMPLLSLGVWDRFVKDAHAPCHGTVSVWGQEKLYENDFIFNPYGHGWHIDRQRFDAMLARAAEEAGAHVSRSTRVTVAVPEPRGWSLEFLENGERRCMAAKFLVDATGRASTFARRQGASRVSRDRLVSRVGFFSARCGQSGTDTRTLVEAAEDGWWYSAWLPGSVLVVAFMTDADLVPHSRVHAIEQWWRRVERVPHTYARIDRCALDTNLRIFAAQTYRMDRITGEAWLAVGDAAAALDPLSSRGIYNGLQSGLRAASSIVKRLLGDRTAFEEYALWNERNFDEYLRMRAVYYGREQRWPSSAFWRRRVTQGAAAAVTQRLS
jgi:flavin-dependent dehydrogenase